MLLTDPQRHLRADRDRDDRADPDAARRGCAGRFRLRRAALRRPCSVRAARRNFLSKSTKWLAIAFFAISLFMAWHATHSAQAPGRGAAGSRPDVGSAGRAAPPARSGRRHAPHRRRRPTRRPRPRPRRRRAPRRSPRRRQRGSRRAGAGRTTPSTGFATAADAGIQCRTPQRAMRDAEPDCPGGGIGRRTTLRW